MLAQTVLTSCPSLCPWLQVAALQSGRSTLATSRRHRDRQVSCSAVAHWHVCSTLQAIFCSSCGISHLFFACRPIGALSSRVWCSLRLSAAPLRLWRGSLSRIRKGLAWDCRNKGRLEVHQERLDFLIWARRGECACPFCSQRSPVVVTTTLAPCMRPVPRNMALSHLVLAVLAVASSYRPYEESLLVSFRSRELSNLVKAASLFVGDTKTQIGGNGKPCGNHKHVASALGSTGSALCAETTSRHPRSSSRVNS